MRRKFTVYGLRFSKTSFWNRINTGFPDPAVATALTACGIETYRFYLRVTIQCLLQQRLPLAVLKRFVTFASSEDSLKSLQQRLPLAVLKHANVLLAVVRLSTLQQRLPLAVLKRCNL